MADDRVLTLEPLRREQYRQVAEWEEGKPLGDGVDWERYAKEMRHPGWAHFGIYDGLSFVGCVSLEKTGRTIAEFHVVTARRMVHPQALADVLIRTAGYLFKEEGCLAVTTHSPANKRAAARLAIRCGMREIGHTPTE